MNPGDKPNPNSVLKNLTREKQDAIIEFCDGDPRDKSRPPHSYRQTVKWLAEGGVKTSPRALSLFRDWYFQQRGFELIDQSVSEAVKEGREKNWLKTADEERDFAQAMFNRMAIQKADAEMWAVVEKRAQANEKLDLIREQLSLERDKFQFNAAKAALKVLPELREIAADNSLDENAKINAVRAKLFGALPE